MNKVALKTPPGKQSDLLMVAAMGAAVLLIILLLLIASLIGIVSGVVGFYASYYLDIPSGACIVLTLSVIFGLVIALQAGLGQLRERGGS